MSTQDEIDLATHSAAADGGASATPSTSKADPTTTTDATTTNNNDNLLDDDEDAELEAMKARVAEMEAEAAKLREMQEQADASMGGVGATSGPTDEEKEEVDSRSIYVGNVDYGATPEEIQQHFSSCGNINRVTILCDKFTGHPKGFAYVEFADPSLVSNAMVLNESLFRGRLIKVTAKRTNLPGMSARGRGRGRGRGRPYMRARGRGRGRGRGW